jgi:hypothetical protein
MRRPLLLPSSSRDPGPRGVNDQASCPAPTRRYSSSSLRRCSSRQLPRPNAVRDQPCHGVDEAPSPFVDVHSAGMAFWRFSAVRLSPWAPAVVGG